LMFGHGKAAFSRDNSNRIGGGLFEVTRQQRFEPTLSLKRCVLDSSATPTVIKAEFPV
jgi:hypothetical protein